MFRFQTRINSASSTLMRRTSLLAAIATIGTVALSLGTASPASAQIRTCNTNSVVSGAGCAPLAGQCTRMTDYYGGIAIYDDGDEATTSSGRKIVCRNGQWYYAY